MDTTWIFKPKYNVETCKRVIDTFAEKFLDWHNQGCGWRISEVKNGWYQLECHLEEPTMMEYWSDTCVHAGALDSQDLTDGMMILLVEAGIAFDAERYDGEYILEDVDMARVITVLCEENTNVYLPLGAQCWIQPVSGKPKNVDLLDALLTLQVA